MAFPSESTRCTVIDLTDLDNEVEKHHGDIQSYVKQIASLQAQVIGLQTEVLDLKAELEHLHVDLKYTKLKKAIGVRVMLIILS